MKNRKLIPILMLLMLCGCSISKNSSTNSSTSSNNTIISTQSSSEVINSSSVSTSTSSSEVVKPNVIDISINYVEDMKYEYYVSETLDFTNVTINVVYEDETYEDINVTEDMVTLIDTSINKETSMDVPGYKMVVINYGDCETSYLINVIDKNAPFDKVTPIISFGFSAGDSFYLGEETVPSAKFYPDDLDYEITYYSSKLGYNSEEYPTTPGIYSMVIEYPGDDKYNSIKTSRYFYLNGDKLVPHIDYGFVEGTVFTIGADEYPTVKVSENATYTITYTSSNGYNSSEFPTDPGKYSMLVEVQEDDTYYADYSTQWFQLISSDKVTADIVFSFKNGAVFTKNSTTIPSVSVPEDAQCDIYFSCETLKNEGKQYKFNSFEELTPGYDYSLVVDVIEDDKYAATTVYRWFTLSL